MTTLYVGPSAAGDEDGSSWANRYGSLSDAEDTPVAAGDVVLAGPGVYRETLTCDVSGGNTYNTGTVSVTKGSATVEGAGTAWVANVGADYMLHVRYYAYGTDGDTNADNTFNSAAGNFQANMVGMPIQINTLGAYTIATVVDEDNITLADPNGLGWPADDDTLTYSVMSGEGHYEIASVTDNDTLVLKQPWQGRTLTGLAYLTFQPITYIADVTGENTDGVGGVVRITGSDNDQTRTRAACIVPGTNDYRTFRGFQFDGAVHCFNGISECDYFLIEDCTISSMDGGGLVRSTTGDLVGWTIRRISVLGRYFVYQASGSGDDCGMVVEDCPCVGATILLRTGGNVVRNCWLCAESANGVETESLTTGQCVWVTNCIINDGADGVDASVQGEIIEDYNCFHHNNTARRNVTAGAHSVSHLPLWSMPLLHAGADQLSGFKFPWHFGDLSEWSPIRAIAGVDERNTDLYGIRRPATAAKNSWGPVQFHDTERETTTTRDGSDASIVFNDAGVHPIWVPVDGSEITVSVYCYREANYAGTNPRLIVKQPGQANDTTADAAAASQWNELTTTLTPSATPPYVVVELQSLNTAAAGNYAAYFDDLTVT